MHYNLLRCFTILLISCFLVADPALAAVHSIEIEAETKTESEDKLETFIRLQEGSRTSDPVPATQKSIHKQKAFEKTLIEFRTEPILIHGAKRHLWIAQFRL